MEVLLFQIENCCRSKKNIILGGNGKEMTINFTFIIVFSSDLKLLTTFEFAKNIS